MWPASATYVLASSIRWLASGVGVIDPPPVQTAEQASEQATRDMRSSVVMRELWRASYTVGGVPGVTAWTPRRRGTSGSSWGGRGVLRIQRRSDRRRPLVCRGRRTEDMSKFSSVVDTINMIGEDVRRRHEFERVRDHQIAKMAQSMCVPLKQGGEELRSCNCIGPQNGEPYCPCRMRGVIQRDGRWIEPERDLGPVR